MQKEIWPSIYPLSKVETWAPVRKLGYRLVVLPEIPLAWPWGLLLFLPKTNTRRKKKVSTSSHPELPIGQSRAKPTKAFSAWPGRARIDDGMCEWQVAAACASVFRREASNSTSPFLGHSVLFTPTSVLYSYSEVEDKQRKLSVKWE